MKAYWWNQKTNFGDYLSIPLLKHFAGVDIEHSSPEESEIIAVGSNLDKLPKDWSGIVVGSAKLHEHTKLSLDHATVLGLRGHLTAQGVRGDFVLGDPGLLADELVSVKKEYNLGVVPHWTDDRLFKRFAHLDPILIDPLQDSLTVVSEIGKCKKIVASSLHGLIVADAFGIPRRFEEFPKIHASHEGGLFKFLDYTSVIGLEFEVGKLQEAPQKNINKIQQELFDMMRALPKVINEKR